MSLTLFSNASIYSDIIPLQGRDIPGDTADTIIAALDTIYFRDNGEIYKKISLVNDFSAWGLLDNYHNYGNNLVYSEQNLGTTQLVIEGSPLKFKQSILLPIKKPTAVFTSYSFLEVEEGSTLVLNIVTTGYEGQSNVTIAYTISGANITSNDIDLYGVSNAVIDNATLIRLDIKADNFTEGNELLTVTLASGSSITVNVLDTSITRTTDISYSPHPIRATSTTITLNILNAYPLSSFKVYKSTDTARSNPLVGGYWPIAIPSTNRGDLSIDFMDSFMDFNNSFDLVFTNPSYTKTFNVEALPVDLSYSVTSNSDTINEGSFVQFTTRIKGLEVGTLVPYTLSGITQDACTIPLTGVITITHYGDDYKTLNVYVKQDFIDIERTLRFTLDGTGVFKEIVITSITPTIVLSTDKVNNTISEGSRMSIRVNTTGIETGYKLPYVITGVDASDIDIPLIGEFTINSGYAGLYLIPRATDNTETNEQLTLTLATGQAIAITITNVNATYTLSTDKVNNTVYKNQSIRVNVTTTGVPSYYTRIPYEITGISQELISIPLIGTLSEIDTNLTYIYLNVNSNPISIIDEHFNFTIFGNQSISLTAKHLIPTYSLSTDKVNNTVNNNSIMFLTLTSNMYGEVWYTIPGVGRSYFYPNGISHTKPFQPMLANLAVNEARTITLTVDNSSTSIDIIVIGI